MLFTSVFVIMELSFTKKLDLYKSVFFCLLTTKIVLLRYVIYKSLADHNKYIAF